MAVKSKVNVDQRAAAIGEILEAYPKEVQEQINASGDEIAKEAVKQLKADSPKRKTKGGAYAKSWTYKTEPSGNMGAKKYIIHNAKHYRIAHLLEKGHAKRGGGRVEARVHIKPIEDMVIKEFTKKVEEAAKK